MKRVLSLIGGLGLAAALAGPAAAISLPPMPSVSAQIVPVAEGCGFGAWRGPWGHCRDTPYNGPLPGGGWVAPAAPAADFFGNGCPPGFWHGPWGHCRDTPYHGALPGGGWK